MSSIIDQDTALIIIDRVCAKRDWQLLSMPDLALSKVDFARRALETVTIWQRTEDHAEVTDLLVERAVVHEYSKLLHEAVGRANTGVQRRALQEVWNYVSPVVRRFFDDYNEATRYAYEALARIWEKRDTVRNSGAFLDWAAKVARNVALQGVRDDLQRDQWQDRDDDSDLVLEDMSLSAPQSLIGSSIQNPAEMLVQDDERRQSLVFWQRLILTCLHRSPQRAEVFTSLVLYERTVVEVAQRLKITANNVYLLKNRAIATLKRCAEFMQFLTQALMALHGSVTP